MPLAQLLIGIGAICGVSTVLAIITMIADATIANYGEVTITINEEKDVKVAGGKPLLGSLMEEKIFIPSACGGRGSCGLCKVKVTSDVGDYLPTELPWITDEEKQDNIRLSCQLKLKKDIAIKIPDELFNVREFQTEVASLKDLTYDIKEVTLKLVEPSEINFKAGQYIQLQVPEYELSKESVYRAYSAASPPSIKDSIQLEIRLVPNGICTTYVFDHLKVGDSITINGPYGEFFLRESQRDIVFIAGGSGMAPIKSILHDMQEKSISRNATYFFGARSVRDLFLVDEMKGLEKALSNFRFVPALSEPLEEDNWKGETGLITEVLDRHLKSGENTEAYLCGSPGMIDASVKALTANGIPEELIYYDKFA
ncbi:MAG: 2Fe-2S iron-sulfur cluster binding domain-containing protein [Spirochaetota bacterium]|nr:MAG: 2Fe-2S iron-sulfur cluster binding domain-containing protein [Spirochaetota bacterium]